MKRLVETVFLLLLISAFAVNFAESKEADSSSRLDLIDPISMIRRARGGLQRRPVLELILGVLDTFQSSAKADLKRIKTRRARRHSAIMSAQSTTTPRIKRRNSRKA